MEEYLLALPMPVNHAIVVPNREGPGNVRRSIRQMTPPLTKAHLSYVSCRDFSAEL